MMMILLINSPIKEEVKGFTGILSSSILDKEENIVVNGELTSINLHMKDLAQLLIQMAQNIKE